jgi:hypothetical protein
MTSRKRDITLTLISLAAVVLLPLYLYWQNRRFFYIDDKVADYIPKLLDISTILKGWEFPFLSTHFMNGSIFAAEFQEGIFNPFILISALLLDLFDNLALGSCVLTIFFLVIAYGGYYLLATGVGIRSGLAKIYSLSITLNCFFIYWYAAAWFNPVNATAFLPYALWASLQLKKEVTLKTSLVFLLCCFLVVSAGWPATLLVLFGFLVLMLVDLLFVEKDRSLFVQNLLIYSATALVCTIPVFPLLLSSEMFTRISATQNGSNFLVGSLEGLLMFAFPAFKDFIHTWGGYRKLSFNTYYAGWYALTILVLVNFQAVKILKNHLWLLLTLTAIFGLAILGPERMGSLRFPIRMLQYYHIFGLLVLFLLLQTAGLVLSRRRLVVLLSLLALQTVLAFQVNPENSRIILSYFSALVVMNIVTFLLLESKGGIDGAVPWILIGTIGVFLCIYSGDHSGRGKDWNVPAMRSDYSALGADTGYVLFNGEYLPTQERHHEFRPASTGLIWKDKIINGYSPLGNKYIRSRIAITDHGLISTRIMKRKGQELFEIDAPTGLELVELMKVSRIISFKGKWGADVQSAASDQWSVRENKHTLVFDHLPYHLPGHISWLDEAVDILAIKKLSHRTEHYQISNTGTSAGLMVFARLWWPGYRATMNGEEIPVERYSGFLIALKIPAQTQGDLVLSFTPPGFHLALMLSVFGLAVILLVNLTLGRRQQEKITGKAAVLQEIR